jgi:hypothetical protein
LSIVISVAFNNVVFTTSIREGFTIHGHHLWSLMFVCALWALKQQASSLLVSTCKNTHVATCTMPYLVILFLRVSSCEDCVRSTFKVHKFSLWMLDSDCECWEGIKQVVKANGFTTPLSSSWKHAFPSMCLFKLV